MATRLYMNLTNNCNANCEFCCMYSSICKKTFLSFERFKSNIDCIIDDIELQLEGGEPLLHRDFYLFLEYARHVEKIKKIIILTNGIELKNHLPRIVDFHKYSKIPITIKVSINYWLLNMNKDHINWCQNYYYATEFIPDFNIMFNVRLRKNEDNNIIDSLKEKNLFDHSNVFYLQSYGRWTDKKDYEKPVIVQNIDNWYVFASDGTCFFRDLIARSEYEKTLD